MSMRWLCLTTAVVLAVPLAVYAAPAKEHGHDHAAPSKSAKKPAPKSAKSGAGTAKPGAKAKTTAGPGAGPSAMMRRPPTQPSSSARRNFDVPQAGSLAETPDVVLNSRVRAALISALSTASQEIIAETKKSVVTLTGTVPSAQQRKLAAQVAQKTRGVRAVKNQLKVKSGSKVSQR
jgi:hyperosmotically inducible protein